MPVARPLIFFLPFLMTGLVLGRIFADGCLFFQWSAAVASGVALFFFLVKKKAHPTLVGLVFILVGASMSAAVFRAPDDPRHVYNLVNLERVWGGRIAEAPVVSYGRLRVVVDIDEMLKTGGRPEAAFGRVQVTVQPDSFHGNAGDRVRFPAELRRLVNFGNPGSFDYEGYQAARGVWATTFLKSPRMIAVIRPPGDSGSIWGGIGRLRRWSGEFIEIHVGQPARGLIKAMVIGDRSDLPDFWRDRFRRLGLAHLLAISGLHVGLVALASFWVIKKLLLLCPGLALRINVFSFSSVLSLIPVWLYAALAGGRPSTLRAAIMVTVFLLAFVIERRRDHLNSLAAAAWIILILYPGFLFSASFQLSFVAVASIFLFAPRFPGSPFRPPKITEDETENRPPLPRIYATLLVPLSVLIGTGPITAYHFFRAPLLSLPANMIFTPLIGLGVAPFGLAALAIAPIWPGGAGFILFLIERYLWLVLPGLDLAASPESTYLLIPRPSWVFFAAYYSALMVWVSHFSIHKKTAVSFAIVAAVVVFAVMPGALRGGREDVGLTVLDVGQGLAMHLEMPDGTEMVVDGGGFAGSKFDTGENIIAPFLLTKGFPNLDIVAMTHPQIDHMGGLPFLIKWFRPKKLWTNGDQRRNFTYIRLMEEAAKAGTKHLTPEDLKTPQAFGGAEINVLWPPPDISSDPSSGIYDHLLNNRSLVLKIAFGNRSMLLTGDIEAEGEAALVEKYGNGLKSDVLVASHHGSRNSSTKAFLECVRPEIILVSAGRNNWFGFPHREMLDRAARIGADVFRTDIHGAITVTTDGQTVNVKTYR